MVDDIADDMAVTWRHMDRDVAAGALSQFGPHLHSPYKQHDHFSPTQDTTIN